jgi:hypothetical protein
MPGNTEDRDGVYPKTKLLTWPITASACVAALILSGCSADDASSPTGNATDPAAIMSCLKDGGFEVEEGRLDGNDREAGKLATFTVYDDHGGTGAVKVYETAVAATEPFEEMAERYPEISVGQAGTSFFDWNGDDAGTAAITGCLG